MMTKQRVLSSRGRTVAFVYGDTRAMVVGILAVRSLKWPVAPLSVC